MKIPLNYHTHADIRMRFRTLFALAALGLAPGPGASGQPPPRNLEARIARFAPVAITADLSRLTPGDRKALVKLIEAARWMDTIYFRQVWSGNPALLERLRRDASPSGQLRLRYFLINMGPWSKLDDDEPFIDGVPNPRPPGANFYPAEMTKGQFERWTGTMQEQERNNTTGFFTAIRKDEDGLLSAVPYSVEYRDALEPASRLLREAADLATNGSLKSFLIKRAGAFLSNDYYDSDLAWMNLDSPIEPTIGPYEVYMDGLFNYKASFEAFIGIRNDEETRKLATFSGYLQEIENNLPIAPGYRNPALGALSPIRVVDEVVTGGEARAGVQTAAFNLPNDERITKEKGSKRVMLKNVQEAKFDEVLVPISRIAVAPRQQALVSFEPFFTFILSHELMHGLGPHTITVNGATTTVREQMQEAGSALEEAKADIAGLFALQYLIDKGVVDRGMEQSLYATYLAGLFRSVRFGTADAHGKGTALQFNTLADAGAFRYDAAASAYSVDFGAIKDAVRKLTGEIMTIQAEGNAARARELLASLGVVRPQMRAILERLKDIPVDIEPRFTTVQ